MADPAQFDHDRLGHLLSDRLLKVPRFQRRYSWEEEHVAEYWTDIGRTRAVGDSYFMGTVVLASDVSGDGRKLIIDGQQRITATAVLLIAARDRLAELGQDRAAQALEASHLSDYVLVQEETVAKLTLSPAIMKLTACCSSAALLTSGATRSPVPTARSRDTWMI